MMLRNLRHWVVGMLVPKKPSTPEHANLTAAAARQARAASISNLQHDVRTLQQAIKDASDSLDRSTTEDERTAATRELASLERALAQKQQERDRFQGRV